MGNSHEFGTVGRFVVVPTVAAAMLALGTFGVIVGVELGAHGVLALADNAGLETDHDSSVGAGLMALVLGLSLPFAAAFVVELGGRVVQAGYLNDSKAIFQRSALLGKKRS